MAKNSEKVQLNVRKKRPGIHSKKKSSHLKTSKNYKKVYNRQGRA